MKHKPKHGDKAGGRRRAAGAMQPAQSAKPQTEDATMSNKDQMVTLMERCDDVVDREVVNLGRWEAKSSFGRAASCRQAANLIAIGDHSPKARIGVALQQGHGIDDSAVLRAPSPERLNQVFAVSQSTSSREGIQDPEGLGDAPFAQALLDAQFNARNAAVLAEAILEECTTS